MASDDLEIVQVRQHKKTGEILGVTVLCPLCNAHVPCGAMQTAGIDPISCPCGFEKRINLLN